MAAYPAFLFYPEDFATGTAHMSPLAVGIYIRCLCHQWSHGFIPSDQEQITRLCGALPDEMAKAWPVVVGKFKEGEPGQLLNKRLEEVRAELMRVTKKRSRAGKAGAKGRWADGKRNGNRNASAMRNEWQSDDKTMASRVEDETEDETESEAGADTEARPSLKERVADVVKHYQTYHPRARAGKKERSKIAERLRDGSTVDDLKLAIDGCHKSPFHCGDNEQGAKYQSLELIFRDSSKTTRFIELAGDDQAAPRSKIATAGESYLARRLQS